MKLAKVSYKELKNNSKSRAEDLTQSLILANEHILSYLIKSCEDMGNPPGFFTKAWIHELIKTIDSHRYNCPTLSSSLTEHQKFAFQIITTWLEALDFPEELLRISQDAILKIDQHYFYPYSLILDCKAAAVRVSPDTWKDIEERMFLPPEE